MAPALPKIDIPELTADNYWTWANLVQSIFTIIGISYTLTVVRLAVVTDPTTGNVTNQATLNDYDLDSHKDLPTSLCALGKTLNHVTHSWTDGKQAWDQLKSQYRIQGAMATFLDFQAVFRYNIDVSLSITPQLDTLQEARSRLEQSGISISDQHFTFIMLQALPDSWSHMVSTLLASQELSHLLTPSRLGFSMKNPDPRVCLLSPWPPLISPTPRKELQAQQIQVHSLQRH